MQRRIGAALLLLALVSGIAMARSLGGLARLAARPRSQEKFVALDRRFAEAVAPAPPDARIGFFFNGRPIHVDERADDNTAIFFLAQYAAAPRVMVIDAELPLVLALVPSDAALSRFCREHGRSLLSHPAPGVALTQRVR